MRVSLILCLVGIQLAAHAGEVDTWARQLRSDPDFKVRLSAGLRLGGLGDRRTIPVFIDALTDKAAPVRTVVCGALARLASREVPATERARALAALKKLATSDPDKNARAAAQSAFESFELAERLAQPRPTQGAIFVQVEPLTDTTGDLGASALTTLAGVAKEAVLKIDDAFLVDWPKGGVPTPTQLQRAGARGAVVVIPTVTRLEVRSDGSRAQIECKLGIIVAKFPEKAARVFVDGGAKLSTKNDAASIAGAKSRCVTDIVKHLIGRQLGADIRAHAK